jgi:hypothetical protein
MSLNQSFEVPTPHEGIMVSGDAPHRLRSSAASATHQRPELMRLNELDPHPIHEILFENAGPRRQGPETRTLAVVRAVVDSLPSKLDATLVTGDLQGLEPKESASGIPRALGEVLAEEMENLGERGDLPGTSLRRPVQGVECIRAGIPVGCRRGG